MPYVPTPRRLSDSDAATGTPNSIDFLRRPQRKIEDDSDRQRVLKHNTTLNKTGDYYDGSPPLEELTYSVPLVRKKSGELVKSSIRLNMLLHESSHSLPTTPTSKQVHFGNDIDVKYFDEHDKPTSISASTSPYASDADTDSDDDDDAAGNCPDLIDTSDDTLTIDDVRRSQLVKLAKASKAVAQSDSSVKSMEKFKRAIDGWVLDTTLLPTVSYSDKIDSEVPIFFERCFLSIEKTKIIGQIAVKNITFSKSVTVRYTYNNWVNTINIDAQYVPDVPRNLRKNGYDRFSFQLSIPLIFSRYFGTNPIRGELVRPPNFEFCIKLSANGLEFWDNNHDKNYHLHFIYKPQLSASKAPDPNQNTPEAMHNRYYQTTMPDNLPLKKKELKKSRSFTKSFSTSDLSELNDINLKTNDNFSYLENSIDSPLRLSIDSLKKTNLNYLNTSNENLKDVNAIGEVQSVPLMRPERGSEIKRSNEGILDRLNDRMDEIKAHRIHVPEVHIESDIMDMIHAVPTLHINNTHTEPLSPTPLPTKQYTNNEKDKPLHSYHAPSSPTVIDPNQRDSSTYRNLVQKYCFFESPVNGKEQHIPKENGDEGGIFSRLAYHHNHHHHHHNNNNNNNNNSNGASSNEEETSPTDDKDKPRVVMANPFMDTALDAQDYKMKHQDSSFGAFY